MNPILPEWAGLARPVIGMLHLPPLPGSPRFAGGMDAVRDAVLRDAEALAEGGVNGLMLENFGDIPLYPGRVPAHVVASMTTLATVVRQHVPKLPLGINVLRSDGQSALAIAAASGARFIRVNVLCGARVCDQGVIQGIAHELLRDRAMLGAAAQTVKIFADIDVKHSAPLAPRDLSDEVEDTLHRALADALIVSGAGTGKSTDPAHVSAVKRAAGDALVFVGSGVTVENLAAYRPHCDGFIVGTSIKREGVATNPVDVVRVRALMDSIRA
jgi:membrane complex biogenesis BtpA family protein